MPHIFNTYETYNGLFSYRHFLLKIFLRPCILMNMHCLLYKRGFSRLKITANPCNNKSWLEKNIYIILIYIAEWPEIYRLIPPQAELIMQPCTTSAQLAFISIVWPTMIGSSCSDRLGEEYTRTWKVFTVYNSRTSDLLIYCFVFRFGFVCNLCILQIKIMQNISKISHHTNQSKSIWEQCFLGEDYIYYSLRINYIFFF